MLKQIRPAIVMMRAAHRAHRPRLSAGHDRHRPGCVFPHQANGSLIEQDGKVIGSELIGQNFAERPLLPWPAVGDDRRRSDDATRRPAPYNAANSSGSQPRPDLARR